MHDRSFLTKQKSWDFREWIKLEQKMRTEKCRAEYNTLPYHEAHAICKMHAN